MDDRTREPQYADYTKFDRELGPVTLGLMTGNTWRTDPRRLLFVLSRAKFVAKMFSGRSRVAEIGCGDGFASRIVCQEVKHLDGYDFDPIFIANAKQINKTDCFIQHDILEGPLPAPRYDAAYSLDVIEHIPPNQEPMFWRNVAASLLPDGAMIVGSPSLESQAYASEGSKIGHVNCKKGTDLLASAKRHFSNSFLFGMNDEVLHTGFSPMCHYNFVLCCGPIVD